MNICNLIIKESLNLKNSQQHFCIENFLVKKEIDSKSTKFKFNELKNAKLLRKRLNKNY